MTWIDTFTSLFCGFVYISLPCTVVFWYILNSVYYRNQMVCNGGKGDAPQEEYVLFPIKDLPEEIECELTSPGLYNIYIIVNNEFPILYTLVLYPDHYDFKQLVFEYRCHQISIGMNYDFETKYISLTSDTEDCIISVKITPY